MKQNKWKKILLSVVLVFIALGIAISAFAGNYLVNYALVVDESGRIGSMGDEVYEGRVDSTAQEVYDAWVEKQELTSWMIQSEDQLSLWAQLYPAKETTHRYVLAVHGYTVDHRDIAPAIVPFVEQGWNVLAIDQRGRGNSEGSYLTMGWQEKDDVILWAKEIVAKDPQAQIILYGESMGAATVMMAAGEVDQLPKEVKAVVEDCGYTSAYDMFEAQLQERFSLPEFPFLPAAAIIGKLRLGFNFYDASAIKQLEKATLPILFLHGGADDYVPTEMVYELYDAYQGEKDLLVIDGAGHGQSADVDPERYYAKTLEFMNQYSK